MYGSPVSNPRVALGGYAAALTLGYRSIVGHLVVSPGRSARENGHRLSTFYRIHHHRTVVPASSADSHSR
jgi:hypothetical protein